MTNAEKPIDKQVAGMTDWRGKFVACLRKVIRSADPTLSEEFKWNCPVFVKNDNVCSIGSFKDHVKVNFFKGAQLTDQKKLLNSGFEAKLSRTIDFHEEDTINETALKNLVKEAVALNK